MQFDVYCPNTTISDVTDYIVDIICDGIEKAGHKIERVMRMDRTKGNKNRGIVVIDAFNAIKARSAGYKFIIYWVQGIIPEESFMRHQSYLRSTTLSCIERYALEKADLLLFVSKQMKEHYKKKYGFEPENYFIIPCFNEELKQQSFSDERYKSNIFLYAGRLSIWQCFERTLALYKKIEEQISGSKFLILTQEKDKAKELVLRIGIQNFEIDFVKTEELSERTKECKFGFCLRDKNEVNYVATPTKLSTYVSNGIMPIYSEAVGSFTEIAKGNPYCLCENDKGFWNKLETLCEKDIKGEEVYKSYEATFGKYYSKRNAVGGYRRQYRAA